MDYKRVELLRCDIPQATFERVVHDEDNAFGESSFAKFARKALLDRLGVSARANQSSLDAYLELMCKANNLSVTDDNKARLLYAALTSPRYGKRNARMIYILRGDDVGRQE